MGRCKNCRWWILSDGDWHDTDITRPLDPDTYEPILDVPEFRYCKSPKLIFSERPPESDWATVVDGSGYRAALLTGGEFGCVNFEAKDNSEQETENGSTD